MDRITQPLGVGPCDRLLLSAARGAATCRFLATSSTCGTWRDRTRADQSVPSSVASIAHRNPHSARGNASFDVLMVVSHACVRP